jgi:Tfp pilus assembly protein PilO
MSEKSASVLRWWRIDAIGVAACLSVTALAYLTLVRPAVNGYEQSARLGSQLAERSVAVADARRSLAAVRASLDETLAAVDRLPLRLEPSAQVNRRLAQLADLAADAGLELHQMQPDPARSGDRYDIVPIALTGTGDYRRVTRFIRSIHDRFADISVVDFELAPGNAGERLARFDLGLAWYTMPAMGMVEE